MFSDHGAAQDASLFRDKKQRNAEKLKLKSASNLRAAEGEYTAERMQELAKNTKTLSAKSTAVRSSPGFGAPDIGESFTLLLNMACRFALMCLCLVN